MARMPAARDRDLVLLGATGFTGRLTALHLAHNAPADLRWALAGRNREKLDAVRAELAGSACPPSEVVEVDVTDPGGLANVAKSTRLLITTVGPYLAHGGPVVAACAEAGTDYVDLTGEAEFVDRTWISHHAVAQATGARLVHACGFDSVPHDLGAQFTVEHLTRDLPEAGPVTVRGVVRSSASFSGGTFHSALGAITRMNQARAAAAERRRLEAKPVGRSSRAVGARPHRDPVLGWWLLPLPTVDPAVVARSGAALEEYGPQFRYSHFAGMKKARTAVIGGAAVAGLALAARVPPLRRQLEARVPQGSGPDEEKRARSWFTVDFVGETDGRRVRTRVSGGDPGYTETSRMLAESALCLLLDDNPSTSGQVTTAVAMGPRLRERLERTGMRFEVVGIEQI